MLTLRKRVLCLIATPFIATLHFSALAQHTSYHLLKKVTLGGSGGWDYLSIDDTRRHLFIARGEEVIVYSLEHDSVIAHIPHTEGVHGVAFAEREGHGFITCGRSNTVLMFDARTLDTIRRIPVGERPDAILYDAASSHVFVMDAKSHDITVLNALTGDRIAAIALPGKPEFAVADGREHIYVNIEDRSEIARINARTDSIGWARSVAPGEEPSGLAIDPRSDRLFIGCGNEKMVVMNAADGSVLKSFKIGKGVDAVAFDSRTRLIFSSCGDGTVTIVSENAADHFQFEQMLKTERGARTMAVDQKTHNIYLVTASFGTAPEATQANPHPRPPIIPGSFVLLKYGQGK